MTLLSRQYLKQRAIPLLFRLRGGRDLWPDRDLSAYGIDVLLREGECDVVLPPVTGLREGEGDVLPPEKVHFDARCVLRLDRATHGDCVKRWGAIVLPGGRALQTGINHHMPRLAAIYPRPWGRKRREDLIVAVWPHTFMSYGDFCMCVLPRVCRALSALTEKERAVACVALPFSIGSWARQYVELIGIPRERQIDTLGENFGLTRTGVAVTVNASSGFWANPGDFEDMWRMMPVAPSESPHRRLMIQRKGSRPLLREKELFKAIRDLGFELLEDKPRTAREQVEIFREAEYVVGPHGAGLSNILWGPRRLGLMEVQSVSWIFPSFRLLCTLRHAPYRLLIDRAAGGEPRMQQGCNLAPLSADPDQFVRAVRQLCSAD